MAGDISWGVLDLTDPEQDPPAEGYAIHAMGEGTDFGNPEALIQVIKSLLTDGSLAVLEGWDNREATLRLRLSAPTANAGPALAAAEAALMSQILAESKPPLVYVPPATDSPTCVFDVVAAKLARDTSDGWDLEEVLRECRYYTLTLTCLPFARKETSTVATALAPTPPTPTTVSVDACTSTSGWTGAADNDMTKLPRTVVLAESGGAVQVVLGGGGMAVLERTGSVTMGATPYLAVNCNAEVKVTPGGAWVADDQPLEFRVDGVVVSPVATSGTVAYLLPPASFTTLQVRTTYVLRQDTRLTVRDVARTDTIPGAGTARQQARQVTVSGSAPTQAAIRLFDATPAALGTEILVHSSRNTAWKPPLRPYRITSATVTSDTAMVSGARNTLTSAMTFQIPANLLTEGTYSLMARLNVTTAGSLGWSAKVVSSAGAATVGSSVVVSGSQTVPITSGYQIVNLAALALPVVRAEADQMIELTLTGTANMTIDEGYLFGLHDGALTWLTDLDSLTWIEIRSPELGAARPSVYGGTGAKGANAVCVDWKCKSFGAHRFDPGLMQIFTVTSTSLVSQSEIEFYERAFGHVAA